jgi:hypothetical protein
MSSLVRSVLGAALLLTGASAAMAASGTPVAAQSAQTGASTTIAASNNAPIADKPQKSRGSSLSDNSDPYGGHDPNSTAGARAFFTPQY